MPDIFKSSFQETFVRALGEPFQRAVFMMLLVSEVHPFADGNGRIARVMMNAELVGAAEERIIIPTAFRTTIAVRSRPFPTMAARIR